MTKRKRERSSTCPACRWAAAFDAARPALIVDLAYLSALTDVALLGADGARARLCEGHRGELESQVRGPARASRGAAS
jgi:hypothetical protein